MGIRAIHGRLLSGQNFTATYGVNVIEEEILVEMDSPLEGQNDVVFHLPVDGQAGVWTFTIGISRHPYRTDLLLKSCNGVRESPDGRPFWIVSVTYETATWLNNIFPNEDFGRGNIGRKKRLDVNGDQIKAPWDEPPTWSSSVSTVKYTVYHDRNGNMLRHANGLPLTEGIDLDLKLYAHHFTWNLAYDTFDYDSDIAVYLTHVNDNTVFGRVRKMVKLDTATCTENYRDVTIPGVDGDPGQTITYHFITVNATFLFSPLIPGNLLGSIFVEQGRRVSMHTMERILAPGNAGPLPVYVPIYINKRGDYAQEPWPLLSQAKATALGLDFGRAVPYDQMNSVNPLTDFHYIETQHPIEANLTKFVNDNGLVIP